LETYPFSSSALTPCIAGLHSYFCVFRKGKRNFVQDILQLLVSILQSNVVCMFNRKIAEKMPKSHAPGRVFPAHLSVFLRRCLSGAEWLEVPHVQPPAIAAINNHYNADRRDFESIRGVSASSQFSHPLSHRFNHSIRLVFSGFPAD
jgi:hypothetical protein